MLTGSFFVHIRVFLGMDPRVSAYSNEGLGAIIPWEVWGPRNTRWYFDSMTERPYTLYGLKAIDFVLPPFDPSLAEPETSCYQLRVLDFNPYSISTSNLQDEGLLEDWQKGKIITECLRTAAGTLFAKDVESYLPYREVITKDCFVLSDVMIDDCRIVLKKDNGEKMPTLTVMGL